MKHRYFYPKDVEIITDSDGKEHAVLKIKWIDDKPYGAGSGESLDDVIYGPIADLLQHGATK